MSWWIGFAGCGGLLFGVGSFSWLLLYFKFTLIVFTICFAVNAYDCFFYFGGDLSVDCCVCFVVEGFMFAIVCV